MPSLVHVVDSDVNDDKDRNDPNSEFKAEFDNVLRFSIVDDNKIQ